MSVLDWLLSLQRKTMSMTVAQRIRFNLRKLKFARNLRLLVANGAEDNREKYSIPIAYGAVLTPKEVELIGKAEGKDIPNKESNKLGLIIFDVGFMNLN